jgi:dUTP pyrophosphatase
VSSAPDAVRDDAVPNSVSDDVPPGDVPPVDDEQFAPHLVHEVPILVSRLRPDTDADLPLPAYALPGDAGADVVAAEPLTLGPGERAVLPTGLAIAVPAGYAAFVHPRSGLAARAGLGLVNAPGTIDSGYRGEVKIIVINHDSSQSLHLDRGERVAQLVIQPVAHARFVEVDDLPDSVRGAGGHGSTGGAAALMTGTTGRFAQGGSR